MPAARRGARRPRFQGLLQARLEDSYPNQRPEGVTLSGKDKSQLPTIASRDESTAFRELGTVGERR
ncbi:hypothetical protein ACYOEI_06415 [Singulisphaera rosea]